MTNTATSNYLLPPAERDYAIEHIAIGSDVRVSQTTLIGEQCVPWHLHSNIADNFFCLEGAVRIEVKGQSAAVTLAVGERYEVKAGTVHRVQSADGKRCRFLLVQGVGKADFIRSNTSKATDTS